MCDRLPRRISRNPAAPRRIAPLLLLALALSSAHAGKGDALPFDLALQVEFAEGVGSASIRDDLEFEITQALDQASCFRSVGRILDGPTGTELLLRVTILEVVEETDVQMTLAQSHDPSLPPDAGARTVARLEIGFAMDLRTSEDDVGIRSRTIQRREQYRPILTEDAREQVRYRMMESVSRDAVGFACKGSLKKLTRDIERARRTAGAR